MIMIIIISSKVTCIELQKPRENNIHETIGWYKYKTIYDNS